MPAAPMPANEAERQKALDSYGLIDTQAEPVFENLTRLVADVCDAPMAIISLIDRNRQWFYARHGLDIEETPRTHALCAYTILQGGLHEICDARDDERLADSPLVTQEPHIRFYAAQPITTSDGFNIGTVCVAAREPKVLNDLQRASLVEVARIVSMLLESRKGILESEERLTHLATHDDLTMLPNRALGLDRLKRAIARAHRYGNKAALLFLDLDGFKNVNDAFGHAAGDRVLIEVAKRLLAGTRETDTVARWGGDEFLVILSDIDDLQDAQSKRRTLQMRLDEPFEVAGSKVCLSASCGLALYPDDGEDEGTLLRHADSFMYEAKRSA